MTQKAIIRCVSLFLFFGGVLSVNTSKADDIGALKMLLQREDPYFGVNTDSDKPALLSSTVFNDLSADDPGLFFDLGNNLVNGAVGSRGDLRRLLIFKGVRRRPQVAPAGVWYSYDFLNMCSSDHFAFETSGKSTFVDQKGLKQKTRLLDGAFPVTHVQIGDLKISQVVMAPYTKDQPVRGLLVGFYVQTDKESPVASKLHLPPARSGWGATGKIAKWVGPMPEDPVDNKDGKKKSKKTKKAVKREGGAEFVMLDGWESNRTGDAVSFTVSKGKPVWIPVAIIADEDKSKLPELRNSLMSIKSQDLISDTVSYVSSRVGSLTLDAQPNSFASLTRRIAYLQLITLLSDKDGYPVGSSWGSDPSEINGIGGQRDQIWMHDTFYNYLSAGLVEPSLMLDGVKFYMTRSVPNYPDVYHHGYMNRIEKGEKRVPHSIGNTVIPIVLAGRYYDLNGDGESLKQLQEKIPDGSKSVGLDEAMTSLLDNLLASREPDGPMLFETFFLSDPRTHGKYHTGSNILVWYAFQSASRLLDEVFGKQTKAKQYQEVADQMALDIPKYCIIEHKGQRMYAEGYQAGKLDIAGEESGTVIASALGFCEVDDPDMLARFKFFSSPENPSYDAETGGAAWMDRCITFPGYVTDFASASTEKELIDKGEKLLSMTDLDGAWWWWPIELGKTQVKRNWVGKCGWGKGVFLTNVFDKILGLNWDAPTSELTIRPFVAWDRMNYQDLRYGSLAMDLSYEESEKGIEVKINHNQSSIDTLNLVLRVPVGSTNCKLINAPEGTRLTKGQEYFGKPTWTLTLNNASGSDLTYHIEWE